MFWRETRARYQRTPQTRTRHCRGQISRQIPQRIKLRQRHNRHRVERELSINRDFEIPLRLSHTLDRKTTTHYYLPDYERMDPESKAVDLLRKTLEEVEKYELPEQFGESPRTTASLVDGALIKQYTASRDEFLKSQIEQAFVRQVTTFNEETESFEMPSLPNLDEQAARKEAAMQSLRNMQRLSSEAYHMQKELQEDRLRLEERKEHLRGLLKAFEEDNGESFCNGILESDETKEEEFVSEEDLQKAEDRCVELQARRKDLLSKLHRIQQETLEMELETSEEEARLGILSTDEQVIAEIEDENERLVAEIKDHKENAFWVDFLKQNVEQVSEFKIIDMHDAPLGSGEKRKVLIEDQISTNNTRRKVEREYDVYLLVGLLDDRTEVEIFYKNLVNRPFLEDGIEIVHVRFRQNRYVVEEEAVNGGKPYKIALDISVGDLAPFANNYSKPLACVVHETICRIVATQEGAAALCHLYENKPFPLDIGMPEIVQNNSFNPSVGYDENYGRFDIEVRMTLKEHGVKVIICLSPDSFHVSKIGGKEFGKPTLDEIRQETNNRHKSHKCLEDLLRDLKKMLDFRK